MIGSTHLRLKQASILKGAAWVYLVETWWRMFKREELAGKFVIDTKEIELDTRVATEQLNG